MSVEHRTLRTEREYSHPISRVFDACADADIKRQWFTFPESDGSEWHSDFHVGGIEYYRSPPGTTPRVSFDARFCDIVTDERIVVTTEVTVDGRRTSATLRTAEFSVTAAGTRLAITEQAAFLDGLETAEARTGGYSHAAEESGGMAGHNLTERHHVFGPDARARLACPEHPSGYEERASTARMRT